MTYRITDRFTRPLNVLNFVQYYIRFKEAEKQNKFDQEFFKITQIRVPMGIEEAIIREVELKGIENGVEKEKRVVISNGIKSGLSKELLAILTELTVAEVGAIIRSIEKENSTG